MDIKETAKNYFNNRLNVTLEDVETLLQDVYDEGKETGGILSDARHGSENIYKYPVLVNGVLNYWVNDGDGYKLTLLNHEKIDKVIDSPLNPQPHYDNSNGSLYKFAEDHKLNVWEFDIIKRIVRARKKGQFKEDLQKTKDVIDIYLREFKACNCGENECCQNC